MFATGFHTQFNVLKRLRQKLNLAKQSTDIQTFKYESILGTSLDLSIKASNHAAQNAHQVTLHEIKHLEKVYSRFDATSELNDWLSCTRRLHRCSADLADLLQKALFWVKTTSGAFHPGIDALTALWKNAERYDELPKQADIDKILECLNLDFCSFDASTSYVNKHFPLGLNFNALAKGMIIDAAALRAFHQPDVDEVLINIGGDLRHLSSSTNKDGVLVGVQDAFCTASNKAPALVIKIYNQAVTTSGASQRGFRIQDKWYSHVINPRTGWPVAKTLSATVIAPDCATADVLATTFVELEPAESLELANSLPNVGCHIVSSTGKVISNPFFDQHRVTQ